jgi:hypothetical protein
MAKKVLVTFGCSWTFGVGVQYKPKMTIKEYDAVRLNFDWHKQLADTYSFRTLLSKKYEFENINFSVGGSSNQFQFIQLRKFFTSERFKHLLEENTEIVVLHGITSTAREYFFDCNDGKSKNLMFNKEIMIKDEASATAVKSYVVNFYNHDFEVERLTEEMLFINQWYKSIGIKNLWFDTFNSHAYTSNIDNFIGWEYNSDSRDLLTRMAILNDIKDIDKQYHFSNWRAETNRAQLLVDTGHLNPISIHPTKLGHELIADIISPYLEKII